MSIKLLLTSKEILEKQFRGAPRGYDPLEVDEFLDKVLADYHKVEENDLVGKKEIESLNTKDNSIDISKEIF